ncbi:MAG: alginate export family protein [Phycisphaerales bacterium]|nr:alginate export family protein [Phycisphaerales bacterium]
MWNDQAKVKCGRKDPGRGARALAVLLAAPAIGLAQPDERRLERAVRQAEPDSAAMVARRTLSFTEQAYAEAGGYFTFTALHLNDSRANSRRMLQYDTTVFTRASFDVHTVFARARARYRDFSPGDSFDDRGDQWAEPVFDRYWYDLNWGGASQPDENGRGGVDLNLRVGRQFVDWGAGLALSEQLYAARPTLVIDNHWLIDGLIGITPSDEAIVDFDASREEFDSDTRRGFFGGMLKYRTESGHEVYGYGLYMEDYNTDSAARFGVLTSVDFNYESAYLGVGSNGSIGADWLYLAEMVFQTGESTSDPLRTSGGQTKEDISAMAARAQLSYQFRDKNFSVAQIETLFATGDGDRQLTSETVGGNLTGTNDEAYNSLGFTNTGLAFAPSLSNIMSLRLGASTFPLRDNRDFSRLQIGGDFFVLGKLNDDGPIDEPTRDEAFLGVETDLFMNYRITSDLAFNLRYGAFFPGSAILGERDVRHFVLFAVTLSF